VGNPEENMLSFQAEQRAKNTARGIANEKVNRLDVTFYVLNENCKELLAIIEYCEEKSVGIHAELIPALREIGRRLHNYVAAVKTYVDHSRRVVEDVYEGQPFLIEYTDQVAQRFTNDGLIRFVHDLRNYTLHRDLPMSIMQISFDGPTQTMETQVMIDIEALSVWDKWTSKSREYMAGIGEKASLRGILTRYMTSVEDFRDWFKKRRKELFAEESSETERRRQEIREMIDEGSDG
jgi:hypothetical protein